MSVHYIDSYKLSKTLRQPEPESTFDKAERKLVRFVDKSTRLGLKVIGFLFLAYTVIHLIISIL